MEGRVLAGRYRLNRKLGDGGMGSVWRAEHLTLGTPIAIKLIDPSIAETAEAQARFQREAQSAAELRSANVVQIIDYGVDDVTPFIAMELLDGESLGARLERMQCLSAAETARILTQVARALTRAHGAGIVHRDLKPENIFLVKDGDEEIAKVLDFGVAKRLDALADANLPITRSGSMLGTPYYMSPEQIDGKVTIDHRADIWAFGIIAYQCLTGFRPFEKSTLGALLISICTEPMPAPSSRASVPPGIDAWFEKATAHRAIDRFQTAAEAASELKRICEGYVGLPNTTHSRESLGAVLASTPHGPSQRTEIVDAHASRRPARKVFTLALFALGSMIALGSYVAIRGNSPERRASGKELAATSKVTAISFPSVIAAPFHSALPLVPEVHSLGTSVEPTSMGSAVSSLERKTPIERLRRRGAVNVSVQREVATGSTLSLPPASGAATSWKASPSKRDYDKSVGF